MHHYRVTGAVYAKIEIRNITPQGYIGGGESLSQPDYIIIPRSGIIVGYRVLTVVTPEYIGVVATVTHTHIATQDVIADTAIQHIITRATIEDIIAGSSN